MRVYREGGGASEAEVAAAPAWGEGRSRGHTVPWGVGGRDF